MDKEKRKRIQDAFVQFLEDYNTELLFNSGVYIQGDETDTFAVQGKNYGLVNIPINEELVRALMLNGFKKELKRVLIFELKRFSHFTFFEEHWSCFQKQFPHIDEYTYFERLYEDQEFFQELAAALQHGRHILE